MKNDAPAPVEIRAPRGARTLEVSWSDGHVSTHPHEVLRGLCPCATCQGHSGAIRYLEGGNLELAELEEVGNYGLSLTWGDGHGGGIYAWRYLRALCRCSACAPRLPLGPGTVLPRNLAAPG